MITIKKTFLALFTAMVITIISTGQPASFSPRGIGGGGALFFPSINPANDNEFYVSCDMSEMFHTTDFGNTYDQIPFSKLQVSGLSTYEFTNDPLIAYCIFNDGNEGYPVRTTNGGASWSQINAFDVGMYGPASTLKANYTNPDQIIIGTFSDILFSGDGGASFSVVRHAANMGAGITIGGVFWDGSNIYIGTNEGLIQSTNGGVAFGLMSTSGMTAGQVIWSFAGAKEGPDSRFVCIASDNTDTYNGIQPWEYYDFAKEVYVMDNANGTWTSHSTGINFATDFVMFAGMAWNDIDNIYLGGNDASTGGPLVFRSDDGGTSWDKKFNTVNNQNIATGWEGYQGDKGWGWSENCFGISVAPMNSEKLIFSTFSNVQVSSNGGSNWKQAYVDNADQHTAGSPTPVKQTYHSIGIENTTSWQLHWHDANTMMACFSDIGGIRSIDGGETWGFNYSGFSVNSLYRIAEAPNGTMYGGCSNIHDMYQSTRLADAQLDANDGNGKIVSSSDGGSTWSLLHQFNHPVFWTEIDPGNPNRMYASVIHFGGTQGSQQGGIYKTDDLNNGVSSVWTKLSNPPRTEGHPACIKVLADGKMVCTFSGRRNPAGTFTASSGVFIFDPAGGTWSDVSDAGMHYWTKDIVIDPTDPSQDTWYVNVFSGWGGAPNGLGGLYKTTNRGASWTKLTGSQFDRVTSITFNPQNNSQAFLTTEMQGLWFSSDMSATTPTWTLVTSYIFRQPERVFFNPFNQDEVWVTSFGNGMKKGSMANTNIKYPSTSDFIVYPNPAESMISIVSDNSTKNFLNIYSATGQLIFTEEYYGPKINVDTEKWSSGIYFIRLNDKFRKLIKY